MSPTILNIRPEEIDTPEKRRNYTISIIGCRETGILHAYLFAEAGFKVICADTDQTIVNAITKGKIPFLKRENELKLKSYIKTGLLNAINDIRTAASKSDVAVITPSVKIDEKKKPNYSEIESICKQVGLGLHHGALIIIVSTTGVGVIEGLIKETLENTSGLKVGTDFGLAYSPIQIFEGQTLEKLANHKRIVAATDKDSLNATSIILEKVSKNGVRKVQNIKVAEATALLEIVHRDVNVALVNELAILCEKLGIDAIEVCKLANISDNTTIPFPQFTQEETQEKPHLLLEDAENLDVKLRLSTIARDINDEMIKHAINLTKNALKTCGKTLRRARISLFGISQLQNTRGNPKRIVKELAEMLEARGARVNLCDPYFSREELSDIHHAFSRNLFEAAEGADCILILTGHEQLKRLNLKKLKVLMKMPAAIIDFEGIIEPDKIEKEGFIYRGLGRGVWTK
ncbi:MAG: nucleotide sugar dehydrogenase [Candidatus Bathyarchaeota archaeon]|jgi:UDP-N-acetyl-D-mannosaminuronic acid dehydrogenase|nr:nucleotide sugar dehydrogenase [Candidatus Bathyarchaeota archaeon A05DMB-5]MDH7557340.1 nucleotide sugar dehydrogenase [Candidatus Bathyarchaeota archaeon]